MKLYHKELINGPQVYDTVRAGNIHTDGRLLDEGREYQAVWKVYFHGILDLSREISLHSAYLECCLIRNGEHSLILRFSELQLAIRLFSAYSYYTCND